MIGQVTVAAATAVSGYDLFRDKTWRVSSKSRRLMGIAAAGSAVAGDCSFDVFIDQFHVGEFHNLALGWPTRDHIVACRGNNIPPGATLSAIMKTAPTTNPINVIVY